MTDARWPDPPLRVIWSRGRGCSALATALDPKAQRVDGNTETASVEARSSLVVRRRMSSRYDLTAVAVPNDLDLDAAGAVVALVGSGPNSRLAARVTARLGQSLGVPARMLCAYRTDGEQAEAITIVEQLFQFEPSLEYRTVQAQGASEIVDSLEANDIAVLGAPAGSWLQRQIFGTGARLLANVPAGSIVVRDGPSRVFQLMEEPAYVSPLMTARDATLLFNAPQLAVVDDGRLLGMVSLWALAKAQPAALVGDLMFVVEPLSQTDPVPDLPAAGGAIPVVDDDGKLVGILNPPS